MKKGGRPLGQNRRNNERNAADDKEKVRLELIKQEHYQMSELFKTYWNGRLTLFAVCLGFIGYLFKEKVTTAQTNSEFSDFLTLGIYFVITLMVRALITISRGIYLYIFRMQDIARQFDVVDFWTTLPVYVKRNPRDVGTYLYFITCFIVNLVLIFILAYYDWKEFFVLKDLFDVETWKMFSADKLPFFRSTTWVKSMYFIVAFVLATWNCFRIWKGLQPSKYWPDATPKVRRKQSGNMNDEWRKAVSNATTSLRS